MSKVVGVIEIVVGIALEFVPGMQAIGTQLIIAGVLTEASALLAPKAKGQQRQAAATTLQLGEVPRQAGFGELVTAGSLAGAFNYGGKYGTDWEVLGLALLDHECEALLGFWVNDTYVAYAGDGVVAGYSGQLEVYWRSGALGQDLPAVALTGGYWDDTDVGEGVAKIFFAYKADAADAKTPVWTAGRPTFLCHLRGAKCYVPRKDGALPGGAGTHRADDPTTWEWTENAIDCRYNWVRGFYAGNRVDDPTMLLVGRGLGPVEAPPVNTFAPANICDETVGGEPRYRVGGVVSADQTYSDVEDMFALATAGVVIQVDGSVEIEPGHAKSPVVYITDEDLLVGEKVTGSDFLSRANDEWANTVVPRYIEPAQKWADHGAPIRRVDADVLADRGPREQTLTMSFVHWASQAGRVAEIVRRLARLWKRYSIPLGPRLRGLEAGDWIVWTSNRRFKGEAVTFRTVGTTREKGKTMLALREIAAPVFSDDAEAIADGAVAVQQPVPPAIGQPGVGAWSLAAIELGADTTIPALAITGACDDSYADSIVFEYRIDDGTSPADAVDWVAADTAVPSTVREEIASVASGTAYYAAVSYRVRGVTGARRILGPVTTGSASGVPSGGDPGDVVFDGGNASGVLP